MFSPKFSRKLYALRNNIVMALSYTLVFGTLIIILCAFVLFMLVYSGMLTTERVYFLTGDIWQVFKLFNREIASIQLTGNWLEQALQFASSVVQSILAMFA